ncbi:hypothetical protein Rhopal_003059-T1 [Rhodotorula paludigena]|uniref:Dihydrodipicolinate synthase family protein n=1 Tax=Rhodotorula paludigena TaxID=86838 RepID=A0AAV5GBV7_9BASI|nr:hypothetical protein Rhopal_003059-T1 [Rhodotorula paludigena]
MPSKFGRAVPHGVYAPLYTFFNDDESLDLESYKKHVRFVASAGVGIVALGSSGEAVHLTRDERNVLISATREVLDGDSALASIPLIVGTSASSTRETIEFAKDAARLGADFGMVISPDPGAAAGIDINSDLMTEIASASTNIVGTKLTLSRITTLRDNFAVFGGFVDFLAPSLVVKSAGCITGLANIAPKTCLKLYRDTESAFSSPSISSTTLSAIQELQFVASRADWVIIKGGINGPKYALDKLNGYGGKPRRPLLPMSEADGDKMLAELEEVLAVERSL